MGVVNVCLQYISPEVYHTAFYQVYTFPKFIKPLSNVPAKQH